MIVLLIIIGIIVGTLSTLGGIGGGVLIIPIFITLTDIDLLVAKGTSLFMILLSSGVGTLTHYRNGRINLKKILVFAVFSIAGSFFSLLILSLISIDNTIFNLLFGLFEIFIALRMILKARKESGNEKTKILQLTTGVNEDVSPEVAEKIKFHVDNKKGLFVSLFLFFLSGMLATFLGIGGGVINTPTLYGVLNFPIHDAAAASTGIIFINMVFNVIGYGIKGQIDWILGLVMGFGMMIGSFFSAHHAIKIPRTITLYIISALLTIVGMNFVINFFL